MSKPKSIYMWENVDNTIQIIESRIDLFTKKTDLYYPRYCSKDNEDLSFKSSHIIGTFVQMKIYLSLQMVLNPTLHTLMNKSLSWKVVFIQDGRIR